MSNKIEEQIPSVELRVISSQAREKNGDPKDRVPVNVDGNLKRIVSLRLKIPTADIVLIGEKYNYEMYNMVIQKIRRAGLKIRVDTRFVLRDRKNFKTNELEQFESLQLYTIISPDMLLDLQELTFGAPVIDDLPPH